MGTERQRFGAVLRHPCDLSRTRRGTSTLCSTGWMDAHGCATWSIARAEPRALCRILLFGFTVYIRDMLSSKISRKLELMLWTADAPDCRIVQPEKEA